VIKNGPYILLLVTGLAAGLALGHLRVAPKLNAARRILYYQDPMHPAYRSDKPGKAPDCGMDLVPVYAEDAAKSLVSSPEPAAGMTTIAPAVQQLYGIRMAKAERDQGKGTIRAFARVTPDETRIFHVNFGTEGFVKSTDNDAVGNFVTKNQHIAVVYSPDFLSVAGGYLAAHERDPGALSSPSGNGVANASQEAASVQARGDRLRNLGMSNVQIDEITKTRKLPEDIYVVSPTDGFILTRNISSGMRFEREADLYTIADLSHVWIVAEVYGKDAQAFRPGVEAVATLSDTGQSFRVRVSDVLPEVDPTTRVMKVRLEADNPGFKLRPNMFVSVAVPVSLPSGVSVPADAILDSGLSKRVFVQAGEGSFESRTVETGWQLGDRVQIVKGLHEGETVVSSGTFLVDSESRLQSPGKIAGPMTQASATSHSPQGSMN
jgi:Cu(I)/Ag(I) efflux system membrane fusion protein